MNYRRALQTLKSRQETVIRLGLARIRRHLRLLGNPHEAFPSIHVAGTNGKGSVCAFLDSILREAGLKVGFYLSPHLEDVRERIRINGCWIPSADFTRLMARALRHEGKDPLTYFEILTSIAFQHFKEKKVDVAVLETGLGGRFDATNVVQRPLAVLIPSIDYDHMNFLGKTLAPIAREKAGVLKRGSPAFCAETKPEPVRILRAQARRVQAPLEFIPAQTPWKCEKVLWQKGAQIVQTTAGKRVRLGILGAAQTRNAFLACKAVDELRPHGYKITNAAVSRGLAKAKWPGRFEVVQRQRTALTLPSPASGRGRKTIILDGAHNVEAMRHFIRTLSTSPWRDARKLFIVGFLRDKEHREMAGILAPHIDAAIVTEPPSPRALPAAELARELRAAAPRTNISAIADPMRALRAGIADRDARVVCVCGSFYLVGLVRKLLGLALPKMRRRF